MIIYALAVLLTKPRRKRLRELKVQELDIRLDELELLDSIIRRLDEQIASIVPADTGARLLDTLPGVAPYTALFLSSTIGDINRFPDSKHLCAYLGLVPSLHQSGDVMLTGHITKLGNKFLRRNMVECARVAVRSDPRLKEFYLREAQEGREEGSDRHSQEDGGVRVLDAKEESNPTRSCSLVITMRTSWCVVNREHTSWGRIEGRWGTLRIVGCQPLQDGKARLKEGNLLRS